MTGFPGFGSWENVGGGWVKIGKHGRWSAYVICRKHGALCAIDEFTSRAAAVAYVHSEAAH